MDKLNIISTIKEWVKIDDEISKIQSDLKKKKELKKKISENLLNVMKTNNLDEFDITDYKIIRNVKKVKMPINKKHILKCLQSYCKTDEETAELSELILNTREEKIKEMIVKK